MSEQNKTSRSLVAVVEEGLRAVPFTVLQCMAARQQEYSTQSIIATVVDTMLTWLF
jgi:hypothetical protein